MTTETFGPMSCASGRVHKSELLHCPEAQYGFILKPSRHRGKNSENREQKQTCLHSAEGQLRFNPYCHLGTETRLAVNG